MDKRDNGRKDLPFGERARSTSRRRDGSFENERRQLSQLERTSIEDNFPTSRSRISPIQRNYSPDRSDSPIGKQSPDDSPKGQLSPSKARMSPSSTSPHGGGSRGAGRERRGYRHSGTSRVRHGSPAKEEEGTDEQTPVSSDRDTKGKAGKSIPLVINYFKVNRPKQWSLLHYSASFIPDPDETFPKKAFLWAFREKIGPYIFDGSSLFCPRRLGESEEEPDVTFTGEERKEGTPLKIELKYQSVLHYGDPVYLQFYNLIVRKCLFGMGLEQMGRNFFDDKMAIEFPHIRINLWPGYITSMKNNSNNETLLNVEVTHKVIQLESALRTIQEIQAGCRRGSSEEAVNEALKGSILITGYNNKSYRIEKVDFGQNPSSTFTQGTRQVSYADYVKEKYQKDLLFMDQPLFLVTQTDKKSRQGKDKSIFVVPEMCQLTGLTEQIRNNFSVMKELSKHLHMSPIQRVKVINEFMERFQANAELRQEIENWGFTFETELVRTEGRVLPKEQIFFANGFETPNDNADWTSAFRSKQLIKPIGLFNWVVFVTERDSSGMDNLIQTMQKVATPLGIVLRKPKEIIRLPDSKSQTFGRAIDKLFHDYKDEVFDMIFVILPTNSQDFYKQIKKRLVADRGVASQCMLAKNVRAKGLMSIATKIVIQMCAKVGGEPWTVKIPMKGAMVVGFETYGKPAARIGAMVASLNQTFTKYYSITSQTTSSAELTKTICENLESCIVHYKVHNLVLPERIIMYRDGGTEGDVNAMYALELEKIKMKLRELYSEQKEKEPPLAFIVISKRTSTRLMADKGNGRVENVPPGTVLDHTVTALDKFDFFLVSATARQGTANPVYYIIIHDQSGLDVDKLQILTYKLCHLYFNWSGTTAIPAPNQYAKKLATLQAVAYEGKTAHDNLLELLYYL